MHFRRFVLGAITTLPMLSLAPLAQAQAQVSTDAAKAFITSCGQQLVAVVNANTGTAEKAQQLQTLVNQMVAVDQVGDYVLGRYKSIASPAQYSQFLVLFHQLLSNNITYQIKAFQGISFTVNAGTSLRITTRNDYASVITSNGGQVSALLTVMQNKINQIKADQ